MRRLYSTFAHGWPGVGLLLMRVVAGIALIGHGTARLLGGSFDLFCAVAAVLGILLLAGLWTPIAGGLVVALEVWNTVSKHTVSEGGDLWTNILLATLGAALALLGPGAWSIDARLFGWKRIDIGDRKS